jgi:hypothetical protein
MNDGNLKMISIALILIVLCIVLFSYQNSVKLGDTDGSKSVNNITTGNNTSIKENVISKDQYFEERISLSYEIISEDLKRIQDSAKNRNFSSTEIAGKFLRDDSNMLLGQINELNASSSQKTILDDYKKSLDEYNIGGVYLEAGSRDRNTSQMNDSIAHIQNGTYYEYRVWNMLYGNNTSTNKKILS